MHIQTLDVSQLVSAPYNPRKPLKPGSPGYRRLARSLQEFELVQPLVWNKTTGHLVSGHQRLEILKSQGVSQIDVVVVELSLEKEKALNIALNNSLIGSEWDATKLIDIVRELHDSVEIDVALTGFDADELNDLLLNPDPAYAPEESTEHSDLVRVQFEVPAEDWESLRTDLDAVLAKHDVRIHVRE